MSEMHKKCPRCGLEKPLTEFYNRVKTKKTKSSRCISCTKLLTQIWRSKNKDHIKNYKRSEANKKQRREHYKNDPNYRRKQAERYRAYMSKPININNRRIYSKKWRAIPHNTIAENLRVRLRKALIGEAKSKSTERLLGITFREFKIYLQCKFKPGMSWDNYGKWHVDHIIPCKHFNLENEYDQQLCFYYLNLQPLWAKQNISKGDSLPDLYCQTLTKLKAAANPQLCV